MPTYDDVLELAGGLPEVERSTSYGTPALKVRGKLICRLWGDRELRKNEVVGTEVLVFRCDPDSKEVLVTASDGAVFETPHYDGYAMALIRLADVELPQLEELLEDAYRLVAPAGLVRQLHR